MTQVIDGSALADEIKVNLADPVDRLRDAGHPPCLATVLTTDDPASETYVRMKQRACDRLGMESRHVEVAPDASHQRLFEVIDELNEDPTVHGILVQLPIADRWDDREVLARLDPLKDVDGLHPANVGRLVDGAPRFKPCTPHGIQRMLLKADVTIPGSDVCIVNRSRIVGKPLANLLIQRAEDANATVTVCHSRTDDLGAKTRAADVLVVGVGRPEFVGPDMVGEGAVVIDVGINEVPTDDGEDTTLVGDVDFDAVQDKVAAISPVPGGVGPMTIAMVLYNTVLAARLQTDVDVTLP